MKLHRCEFKGCKNLTTNKKFCSLRCSGKNVAIINKTNHTGMFHDKKIQSKAGKIGGKVTHQRHPNQASEWGKSTHILYPNHNKKIQRKFKKENKGFYSYGFNSEMGRRGAITNKKNKTGLYDPKVQSMGGTASIKSMRYDNAYIYKNLHFTTKIEIEIAININYQFKEKLIFRKNFQVRVGNKLYDFLIEKHKCFIEPHQFHTFFNRSETLKSYYTKRRVNLNINGYKDYNLIVIQ